MDGTSARMYAGEGRPSVPPEQLLPALLHPPKGKPLLSDAHFSADGTLIEAWAGCKNAIDARTTRHPGYGVSQMKRKMAECIFGWGKQHGALRKTKHRGLTRAASGFLLNLIACNLIRIPKLLAGTG